MQNLFGSRKKMPPAIIPEKAIILHTLEDAYILYIFIHLLIYRQAFTCLCTSQVHSLLQVLIS
jgi:hypothetical protein